MKTEQRKGLRGRHPVAWSRATRAGHVALALWFAYWAWRSVSGVFYDWPAHLDILGVDGRLYYRAASTFMAGGDPWTSSSALTHTNTWPPSNGLIGFQFTGPPPTVLAFVPFVWIPEWLFVPAWFGLSILAAVYIVRRLHLPIYWLLFPPLVQGISVGNPHVVCLALLLCSSNWLRALAAPMKAYAVIPMLAERQWRALAILAVAGIVSVVIFWPLWIQYRWDYAQVNEWLIGATHGGASATRDPRLFALTACSLGLLALIDRKAAGWLAVPALWPAAQYFYASFAMPLRSPWLAAALAMTLPRADAVVPWAIVVYSLGRVGLVLARRHHDVVLAVTNLAVPGVAPALEVDPHAMQRAVREGVVESAHHVVALDHRR